MSFASIADHYSGRVVIYALGAVVGSTLGATLTWTSDTTSDANPLTAGGLAAFFSLGPAIAIAAVAAVRAPTVGLIAVAGATAMVTMWSLFVASDSSTAAIVFTWGVLIGVPLAIVLVVVVRTRQQTYRQRDGRPAA